MIEMVLDDLKDYFKDEGFKVDFEVVSDTSVYVYFLRNTISSIDTFYKMVTNVTHKFGKDVVPLDDVCIVTMDSSLYLMISIIDPR